MEFSHLKTQRICLIGVRKKVSYFGFVLGRTQEFSVYRPVPFRFRHDRIRSPVLASMKPTDERGKFSETRWGFQMIVLFINKDFLIAKKDSNSFKNFWTFPKKKNFFFYLFIFGVNFMRKNFLIKNKIILYFQSCLILLEENRGIIRRLIRFFLFDESLTGRHCP